MRRRSARALAALGIAAVLLPACLPGRDNPLDPANRPDLLAILEVHAATDSLSNVAAIPDHLVLDGDGSTVGALHRFIWEGDEEDVLIQEGESNRLDLTAGDLEELGISPLQVHAFRLEVCSGIYCEADRESGAFISTLPPPIAPFPVQVQAGTLAAVSLSIPESPASGRSVCWKLRAEPDSAQLSPPALDGEPCAPHARGETVSIAFSSPEERRTYPVEVWTTGDDGPSPPAYTAIVAGGPELIVAGGAGTFRVSLGQGPASFPEVGMLAPGTGARLVGLGPSKIFVLDSDGQALASLDLPGGSVRGLAASRNFAWADAGGLLQRIDLDGGNWSAASCAAAPGGRTLAANADGAWTVRLDGADCVLARVEESGACVDAGILQRSEGGSCSVDLTADPLGLAVWADGESLSIASTADPSPRILLATSSSLLAVDGARGAGLVREPEVDGGARHRWISRTASSLGNWRTPNPSLPDHVAVESATGSVWSVYRDEGTLIRSDLTGIVVLDIHPTQAQGEPVVLSDGTLLVPTAADGTEVYRAPALDRPRSDGGFPGIDPEDHLYLRGDGALVALVDVEGGSARLLVSPPGSTSPFDLPLSASLKTTLDQVDPGLVLGFSDALGGVAFVQNADLMVVPVPVDPSTPPGSPIDAILRVPASEDLGGGMTRYFEGFAVRGDTVYATVWIMDNQLLEVTDLGLSVLTVPSVGQATVRSLEMEGAVLCTNSYMGSGPCRVVPLEGGALAAPQPSGSGSAFDHLRDADPPEPRTAFSAPAEFHAECMTGLPGFAPGDPDRAWVLYEPYQNDFGCMAVDGRRIAMTFVGPASTCGTVECAPASVLMPTSLGTFSALAAESAPDSAWVADLTSGTLTQWRWRQSGTDPPVLVRGRALAVPKPERLIRP